MTDFIFDNHNYEANPLIEPLIVPCNDASLIFCPHPPATPPLQLMGKARQKTNAFFLGWHKQILADWS
jgi:hypothetical protein